MQTLAELIQSQVDEFMVSLKLFLEEHCEIVDRPPDRNLVFMGPPGMWTPLRAEGELERNRLVVHFGRVWEIAQSIIPQLTNRHEHSLLHIKEFVEKILEQESLYEIDIDDVCCELDEKSRGLTEAISLIHNPHAGECLVIPDTNALYHNTKLDEWTFSDTGLFTILLTPTVMQEIDRHKDNGSNSTLQAKAEKLVRQIKGYRNRGRLADGVPLRKGISNISTYAIEPSFDYLPSWISPKVNDDRILASVFDIARRHCHARVCLVTRDVNLQNKAEVARIEFMDPPDP